MVSATVDLTQQCKPHRLRPYKQRRSCLERHRATIKVMRAKGASLTDIQFYLNVLASPRVTVERSTILRFIRNIESS